MLPLVLFVLIKIDVHKKFWLCIVVGLAFVEDLDYLLKCHYTPSRYMTMGGTPMKLWH